MNAQFSTFPNQLSAHRARLAGRTDVGFQAILGIYRVSLLIGSLEDAYSMFHPLEP